MILLKYKLIISLLKINTMKYQLLSMAILFSSIVMVTDANALDTESILMEDTTKVDIIDSLGLTFPYIEISAPFKLLNKKPLLNKSDMRFIPVDNVFEIVEGQSWSAFISIDKNDNNHWSLMKFIQQIEQQVYRLGGKKVSDGKVPRKEIDRVKNDAVNWGEEGSMDYWNNAVKTYVIERANGAKVYIHIGGNSASGAMQVIETSVEK